MRIRERDAEIAGENGAVISRRRNVRDESCPMMRDHRVAACVMALGTA
jgi:hypothetical protein